MKNLAYCTALVMLDLEMFSSHDMKRLNQYASDGYKWAGMHGDNRVKVAYITPNDVYKADLPDDFMSHTKVGINYGGQWMTLTKNDELFTSVPTDCCGDDIFNALGAEVPALYLETLAPYGFNWINHFRAGNMVGEMYSQGGGFSSLGSFSIDNHNNIIQFDPRFPKTTYALEYISNGSSADGSTLIPDYLVPVIRAHIKYELENNKRGRNRDARLVDELWGQRNVAKQEMKDVLYLPTLSEWCDISYQQYQSSPKR